MLKTGDLVVHDAYGTGVVQDREETKGEPIVLVKWDSPEMGRFPEDKLPWEHESFWTDESDLVLFNTGSATEETKVLTDNELDTVAVGG